MATYKRQRYLLMTTDPVHIGTGGYRLGRVDNSIVREPGTRVPKIPGTSLHGAARSYAAQLYETPEAAGQSQDKVENPDLNPVCYTFGYIKKVRSGDEEKAIAYSGVVNIFDAHILLFPVHSMAGPVWVSTVARLNDAGFTVKKDKEENKENNKKNNDKEHVKKEPAYGKAFLSFDRTDPLNLGWLMVEVEEDQLTVEAPNDWKSTERWQEVRSRIVLVNEALFSHIVNSNLEVRTSVSIDPETGAAEEGALFTYEAIPRATFLTMDVVLDDYRENFPSKENLEKRKSDIEQRLVQSESQDKAGKRLEREKKSIEKALEHIGKLHIDIPKDWSGPLDVVEAGLRVVEWLGVGGMGTRGFGRIGMVGKPQEKDQKDTGGEGKEDQE